VAVNNRVVATEYVVDRPPLRQRVDLLLGLPGIHGPIVGPTVAAQRAAYRHATTRRAAVWLTASGPGQWIVETHSLRR
jgi:hypothetical protein